MHSLIDDMHRLFLERLRIPSSGPGIANPFARLTDRKFEVLRLAGFGFGPRQIAEKLNRTIKTIKTHCSNSKEKLGLNSASELIRFATRWFEDKR
jgi:DNA-binding NarL/FixJ family response regulator